MAEQTGTKRGTWLTILLTVVALIGLGFTVYTLAVSWHGSRSDDSRRVRDLAIAAGNITNWPDTAEQIGRSNLYDKGTGGHPEETGTSAVLRLRHPSLGDFQVRYFVPEGKPSCAPLVAIREDKLTVQGTALSPEVAKDDAYYRRLRAASWFKPAGAEERPICFVIADLDLRSVTSVPEGFQHLLLAKLSASPASAAAGPDGTADASAPRGGDIVAQIAERPLPIRSLAEVPAVQPQLLDTVRVLAQAASGTSGPAPSGKQLRSDALEPLNSSVGGTSYRFYFYPVTLKGGGAYLLVGTVRGDAEMETFDRLGPRALAFAIALLLLGALTPTLKLAMLGPVDGMRPIEAGALIFGLLAAVAFATAALIAVHDVIDARTAASRRLVDSTAAIRARTLGELRGILLGEGGSRVDALAPLMWSTRNAAETGAAMIGRDADRLGDARDFAQPDALLPIALDGRQPPGMARAVSRDLAGIGLGLSDRAYFYRTVAGNFSPDSARLVGEMRSRLGGVWKCLVGGLAFEQVRSRADGVPKTLAGARVSPACVDGALARSGYPLIADPTERLQVIGLSMVLRSLLAPSLHKGERFAILDAGDRATGFPVLFHSIPGRANVELFGEALNGTAQRGFDSIAASSQPCGAPTASLEGIETFGGEYEGTPTLFAATRLPCTDWVIVTFVPRDDVDRLAVKGASYAILYWTWGLGGLVLLFLVAGVVARATTGRPAWLWLWPDPARRERYRLALGLLLLELVIALPLALFGGVPFITALLSPIVAGVTLYAVILGPDHLRHIRPPQDEAPNQIEARRFARALRRSNRPVLDELLERRVEYVIVLLVLLLCTVPMIALSRDARTYFEARLVGQDLITLQQLRSDEQNAIGGVALAFRQQARQSLAPLRADESPFCAHPDREPLRFGSLALERGRPCYADRPSDTYYPSGLTASMRRGILHLDQHGRFGDPAGIERPGWNWTGWVVFISAALALVGLLAVAFRSALRGLFGFGVVLEAVDYPTLPMSRAENELDEMDGLDAAALPARFIAVATPDHITRLLSELAHPAVDLFAATEANASPLVMSAKPVRDPPLLLFRNLEMLMRNRDRRLRALAILERAIASQRQDRAGRNFTIALITDLSPLDRLLQSYERDAEELERLTAAERHSRRAELAGEREDVRWSRLFESFTTYTYRARPRRGVDEDTLEPDEKEAVRTVEKEVAYLPDHVVAAIIPDRKPPLRPGEIADWAKTLKGSAPRAIVDYLTSQLIEHYQLAWSVSSHAERLLLHHYAHRQIVNIGEAYAVRSLVRRGLVVLDPTPRIMNRSFAQFIRHAEEPKTLERWRGNERSDWQKLRLPLMIALPFALGVVALVAIRSGESVAALLPFLVSVGPAVINFFGSSRRSSA